MFVSWMVCTMMGKNNCMKRITLDNGWFCFIIILNYLKPSMLESVMECTFEFCEK